MTLIIEMSQRPAYTRQITQPTEIAMTSKYNVGAVCTCSVVHTVEDTPLRDAAELMRKHHVKVAVEELDLFVKITRTANGHENKVRV
ncbi:hypothetical protein RugamoR57_03260 [Duganella caerulea]|uniref:hypothetical protein n=1 Tax=Duganella caerulea TaxID=2885762 RepID=UPI0030EA8CA9